MEWWVWLLISLAVVTLFSVFVLPRMLKWGINKFVLPRFGLDPDLFWAMATNLVRQRKGKS